MGFPFGPKFVRCTYLDTLNKESISHSGAVPHPAPVVLVYSFFTQYAATAESSDVRCTGLVLLTIVVVQYCFYSCKGYW